jgi:hypothetical protein
MAPAQLHGGVRDGLRPQRVCLGSPPASAVRPAEIQTAAAQAPGSLLFAEQASSPPRTFLLAVTSKFPG